MAEIRKQAEAHWKYTYGVIKIMLKLVKYLYIEAYVHGYKHGMAEVDDQCDGDYHIEYVDAEHVRLTREV